MYQDRFDNKYLYLQTSKTYVQVETNKVLHESVVEDRHLVAGFETACSEGSRFERVGSVIALPNRQKPCQTSETSSTCFLTPMHLWDQKFQKFQHRNPLKNGSLSENVMKEGERVLFQPLH